MECVALGSTRLLYSLQWEWAFLYSFGVKSIVCIHTRYLSNGEIGEGGFPLLSVQRDSLGKFALNYSHVSVYMILSVYMQYIRQSIRLTKLIYTELEISV